ncbi:hypothetical protein [Burkholderia pyrrocinia]|nr:hypothetical protein [Burkholderia pyrrocinia]
MLLIDERGGLLQLDGRRPACEPREGEQLSRHAFRWMRSSSRAVFGK